jgi:hypothetical protein
MRLLRCSVALRFRRLAPVLGLIALLAFAASATETRVSSLGGDGDYFEDVANVPRWYGSLPSYANTAVLELGQFDASAGNSARDRQAVRQGAGALFDLDSDRRYGTLGLYLFRDEESADGAGARVLMYGKAWIHAQAGLVVGYRRAFYHGEIDEDLRETLVGLGARLDLGETTYLDLAGDWRGTSTDYREPGAYPVLDSRSWDSFSLRARAFHGPREGWALVPVCAYRRDDRWLLGEPPGRPVRRDSWDSRYGIGVNLFPTGDVMGLVSCERRLGEASHYVLNDDGDMLIDRATFDMIVLRLGLEARLRPWLSLRAGAFSTPDHRRGEPATNFGLTDDFDLTLGCGLHLGELDADFLFNDDAPFNLGSLVTNAGAGEASTFSSVSLAYRF